MATVSVSSPSVFAKTGAGRQYTAAGKMASRTSAAALRPRLAALPRTAKAPRTATRSRGSVVAKAVALEEVRAPPAVELPTHAFERIAAEFHAAGDAKARYQLLLQYARRLPPLAEEDKVAVHRVMGCTAQVWLAAELDAAGRVVLRADSDSELTRGLAGVLVEGLAGLTPHQLEQLRPEALAGLGLGLGPAVLTPSRTNGFLNMLETARKRARFLTQRPPRFPSLLITPDAITPQGAFAEAQARYLEPDAAEVAALAGVLAEKRIGIVAHFYMDPQVQGALVSAAATWPHIHISDSLVMADRAVAMAKAGCQAIAVLGVDFMSENVRAILQEAGYGHVKVYRMSAADIGCSLAEAAESEQYMRYLQEAAVTPNSLHVVYINTSLRTKATAHALVPTITCTSSNVVNTVLQAFAQVPGLVVWYGPDTYMGANLAQLFTWLAQCSDEEIRALHPAHTQASIRALLPRLRYFQEGTCIVHHIFGGEVCEAVTAAHGDAYLTAHFEVPGEMFGLAMAAKRRGMGVVGSTQNILDFIAAKLGAALDQPFPDRLQFVLGTESGMITSIVRKVQAMMRASGRRDVEVEVLFPVSPEAITTAEQAPGAGGPVTLPNGLTVVPGPASGEGCGTEGGCASCPYMKMNSLTALMKVAARIGSPAGEALLAPYQPRAYSETIGGRTMAQAGCLPILHMRDFQAAGALPDALVQDITSRHDVP